MTKNYFIKNKCYKLKHSKKKIIKLLFITCIIKSIILLLWPKWQVQRWPIECDVAHGLDHWQHCKRRKIPMSERLWWSVGLPSFIHVLPSRYIPLPLVKFFLIYFFVPTLLLLAEESKRSTTSFNFMIITHVMWTCLLFIRLLLLPKDFCNSILTNKTISTNYTFLTVINSNYTLIP